MHTPSLPSATASERREGPTDRRLMVRAQTSDRRLATHDEAPSLASEDVHMRPPLDAGETAPASENTSLLFERS